jgi:regulatory protein
MRSAKPSLKARALRYLSAREHSRLELARKLARYAEETDDIEALLDWLETSKFLSSTRFAESLINRRAERFGASRILMELESHQIDLSGMTDLSMQLREGEGERAWRVWEKKIWYSSRLRNRVSTSTAVFTAAWLFSCKHTNGHA